MEKIQKLLKLLLICCSIFTIIITLFFIVIRPFTRNKLDENDDYLSGPDGRTLIEHEPITSHILYGIIVGCIIGAIWALYLHTNTADAATVNPQPQSGTSVKSQP